MSSADDSQLDFVRQELRLRWEIAAHELRCLMDDGAPAGELDAKLDECFLIEARRDDLERRLLMIQDVTERFGQR